MRISRIFLTALLTGAIALAAIGAASAAPSADVTYQTPGSQSTPAVAPPLPTSEAAATASPPAAVVSAPAAEAAAGGTPTASAPAAPAAATPAKATPAVVSPAVKAAEHSTAATLPFTGFDALLVFLVAGIAGAAGIALRRMSGLTR